MTSILLVCLWALSANVIGMIPSPKRKHWPAAWVLIATGLPLLAFLVWENGLLIGLIGLVAGASVLRWPVWFLWRWIRRRVLGR
ncbi:MAG: DUF2484 family protein [Pseudomonadota bacterium]